MTIIVLRALTAAALASALHACGDSDRAERSATPAILPSFAQQTTNADASPPKIPYSPDTPRWLATVAQRWPHDSMAFTQGLLVHDGRLLESTGVEGRSDVREVDRGSGRVIRRTNLAGSEFGEGIALLGRTLYQLTWKSGKGRTYDARTLAPLDSFSYEGEGWGLATDGKVLYLSDGTSRVRVIDPNGFRVRRTIQVSEVGKPIYMLNELEWVRGELWANVYETNFIVRIDPLTGHVLGWIDLSRVLTENDRARVAARGGVANGIAYDSTTRRLLVTGKYWPYLAQLDSVPSDD
ncbi:MAG: glutaminyl-peptide cyclotransferase [Gemmatimonadaceae bacterium]